MSADELRLLGYEVVVEEGVVAVRGYGLAANYAIDAPGFDEWAATFADPVAHAERVRQAEPGYVPPAPVPSSPLVSIADVRELLAAAVPGLDLAALDAAIATVETPATKEGS